MKINIEDQYRALSLTDVWQFHLSVWSQSMVNFLAPIIVRYSTMRKEAQTIVIILLFFVFIPNNDEDKVSENGEYHCNVISYRGNVEVRLWTGIIICLFSLLFSLPIHFYYYYFSGISILFFDQDSVFIRSFFFCSTLDADSSGVDPTSTANQSEFLLLF
jgi:hypothetical protein